MFAIAAAVNKAATEQGVAQLFCWGGVWDRWLSQYGGTPENMKTEVAAYAARHPGAGLRWWSAL
jgi:hypothetical protein